MCKLFFILSFTLFIFYGCGTTRSINSTRDPFVRLKNDINSILSDTLFTSTLTGIKVISVNDGKVFYEHNSKLLINPASNTKLVTTAVALSVLDTNYQFSTSVSVDRYTSNKSIAHNLYLKGYGDPYLCLSDLDSLASAVSRTGITAVLNDIVIDNSFFDSTYWGAGWMWDDESDPDSPYISPLSVNKNCIRVSLSSDSINTYLYVEPTTDYVKIINNTKVVNDSVRTPVTIRLICSNNTNTIFIDGELSRYSKTIKKLSICNPQYYAGTLFKDCLRRAGVAVLGKVVFGEALNTYSRVAQLNRPIEEVVRNMNKASDNLAAENILKVLSARMLNPPGTAKGGISIINKYMSDLGIDTLKYSIVDGSGVSRYNLISADLIVYLLSSIYKQPRIFSGFYNSLPIAGIDGTLSGRMKSYPSLTNVHAKTGNLSGVSCLSGYVRTLDGEMLVFSMMMQNFINSTKYILNSQDRICTILAGFSRKHAPK